MVCWQRRMNHMNRITAPLMRRRLDVSGSMAERVRLGTELQKDSETCSSEGAPCLTVVNQTRSPRQGVYPQTSCRVQLPQLGDGLA